MCGDHLVPSLCTLMVTSQRVPSTHRHNYSGHLANHHQPRGGTSLCTLLISKMSETMLSDHFPLKNTTSSQQSANKVSKVFSISCKTHVLMISLIFFKQSSSTFGHPLIFNCSSCSSVFVIWSLMCSTCRRPFSISFRKWSLEIHTFLKKNF